MTNRNKNDNPNQERFEFVLRINRNIICQRYFEVKGYNEEVLNSIDLKNSVEDVIHMIEVRLEKTSRDYLWKFHNPLDSQSFENIPQEGIWDNGIDTFDLIIKMDGRPLITRPFYGNYYPPRVRYQVDIKDLVPRIVDTIRGTLSSKELTNVNEVFEH